MPFISLLDDRAKPKGSRDPLGFELVWSHFGRKVVGNLTTITSSMDNFAVAILGFYWVNQLIADDDSSSRNKMVREAFLRYEQLTGYIRYYGKATDIMGITRIKKRVDDDTFKLTLGLSANQQILSDQASYGLWGLYSTAARESGLVIGADRKMASKGIEIALAILKRLGSAGDELYAMIQTDKKLKRKSLENISTAFTKAIHHKSVQEPLLEVLMTGDNNVLQTELWHITQRILKDSDINEEMNVGEYVEKILYTKPSVKLTQCLTDIVNVERLLVSANNIFHYCRGKNTASINSIVSKLDNNYVFLPAALPDDTFQNKSELQVILNALKDNKTSIVIAELLNLNKLVMKQRNGAPWLEISNGVLDVKVKNEKAQLKGQEKLETNWDYDYFLGSYLKIARKHLR